jgi:hypothetical protein
MDTVDAGRKGGSSRSERKRAASAANLAKARARVAKAMTAFHKAELEDADAEWEVAAALIPKPATVKPTVAPTLITGNGGK